MEQHEQNGSPARQASLHAHIIRKQKPGNSAPPYPYSHLQRIPYRTSHFPALWREEKRTALRWQMQHASSANPTRCIGTRNALHLIERFSAVGKEIFCSWERDLLQLEKRFAAIGKEICCDWKWNAAKQVTNLTKRDDEIS